MSSIGPIRKLISILLLNYLQCNLYLSYGFSYRPISSIIVKSVPNEYEWACQTVKPKHPGSNFTFPRRKTTTPCFFHQNGLYLSYSGRINHSYNIQSFNTLNSYPGQKLRNKLIYCRIINLKKARGVIVIITMNPNATKEDIENVETMIEEAGYTVHPIYGTNLTVLAAVGDERGKENLYDRLTSQPMVDKVEFILPPFKLVCREMRKGITRPDTFIDIEFKWKEGKKKVTIGSDQFVVMAGPCSVETRDQIMECARFAKDNGATILRGGAFKPRTSPYSFQGLEEEGLKLLAEARHEYGLAVVTELMDAHHLELVDRYADIIQIGARNMQNFMLLKSLSSTQKPVLLKRGMSSTLDEWLMSAEYIASVGNSNVILCERGIRTFETRYRNTLDLNAVPALKKLTHLPLIVDPSHGTGRSDLVLPMALAAAASGCHGVILEIHPQPSKAWSDGAQSLDEKGFQATMNALNPLLESLGKSLIKEEEIAKV